MDKFYTKTQKALLQENAKHIKFKLRKLKYGISKKPAKKLKFFSFKKNNMLQSYCKIIWPKNKFKSKCNLKKQSGKNLMKTIQNN